MYDVNRLEVLLAEAAEGELGAENAQELEAMLEESPDGRRTLNEMRVLVRAEKALSEDMPQGMHEFIMDGIEWQNRLSEMQRRTKIRALAAAAVAALVLLGAGLTGVLGNGKDSSKSASAEARMTASASTAEITAEAPENEAEEFDAAAGEESRTADAPEEIRDKKENADMTAAPDSTAPIYEGETDDPIEQRLALNTDCHTIVIADFAPPEEEPLFTLDGYAAYELEKADFEAMQAGGSLKNVVVYTNYDGAGENILLALRPQDEAG